jgi:hypothetical protein
VVGRQKPRDTDGDLMYTKAADCRTLEVEGGARGLPVLSMAHREAKTAAAEKTWLGMGGGQKG